MQIADEVGTSKIIFAKMYFCPTLIGFFFTVGQRLYDKEY